MNFNLRRRWIASIVTVFAAMSSAGAAGTASEDFTAALAKWRQAALSSYEFTVEDTPSVRTSCDDGSPARLTVHKGKVTRGVYLKAAGDKTRVVRVPGSCLKFLYSVESLFAYLAQRIEHCPKLRVTYDARYGYPMSVDDVCTLDGESPIKISSVTPENE